MNRLSLGQLLGIRYPILLGGMRRITDPFLTAAVSNAGGLGTLAGATETATSLADKIQETRKLTANSFAVNIPVVMKNSSELVEILIQENVEIAITSAGNPRLFTERLKAMDIVVIHVVPSPELARKAESEGADALIAEGFESGGRASRVEIGTMALIPQVTEAVNIPVIAAGGITDSRGYLAARILGAAGVSLGTAFLASKECHKIGHGYKKQLLSATAADTFIGDRKYLGIRVLRNNFYDTLDKMFTEKSDPEDIRKYIISSDLMAEEGLFSCGQGVGLINEIKSVRQIIEDIVQGSQNILQTLSLD